MSKNSCSRADLPWEGRGASMDISGCRFSLYPMHSQYAQIITEALQKTNINNVWHITDATSTVYRGRLLHVVDAVRGLFVNAYKPDVHMALEGQFSKGCPGDVDADSYLAKGDALLNTPAIANKHFDVKCKIALYPLGQQEYIDLIAEVFYMAQQAGLSPKTIHYATRIDGDVHQVMDYLQKVCEYVQQNASHYVLTFTLSVNSPTQEEKI
ncbi:MAG: YkoF family thiamine/hydroxymethylpyrimidine-binding protein [Oscillospiraceae bacterium]